MTKKFMATVVALMAASVMVASSAMAVPPAPTEWEKCGGVSKAGKNDCGSLDGSHSCSAQATKDDDPNEWIYVPKGTCDKLGGTVIKVVPAK